MSSQEWIATLGELGHAGEFWNKFLKSPKKFFNQDLKENPLSLFSLAAPLVATGATTTSVVLTLLLLNGLPSCSHKGTDEAEAAVTTPPPSWHKLLSLRPRARAIKPPETATPSSTEGMAPVQATDHGGPDRSIGSLGPIHGLVDRQSAAVVVAAAWIPEKPSSGRPLEFVGRAPNVYLSPFDDRELPRERAFHALKDGRKRLAKARTLRELSANSGLGHDVERID